MSNDSLPHRTACIIPARGGSKGIPRKNLADLIDGISLLEWTIKQALRCYPVEDVLVSTEDAEIARVAGGCGARAIERPAKLASDHSTTTSVVADMLARLDAEGSVFKLISILQVTSPLRKDEDVTRGRTMIESGAFDSVVSAYEAAEMHPAKMYFVDEPDGVAISAAPQFEFSRRQDLPRVVRRNGAIFNVTRAHFERTRNLWGGRVGLVEMPRERSIDIDTPNDLGAARKLLEDEKHAAG